jgi:hypothetical protein
MRIDPWVWLPMAAVSISAHATTYLTIEQAQQAMFPGKTMTSAPVTLSENQAAQITQSSGVRVFDRNIKAWKVEGGGWFILDEVVGKHDLITYAVGIDEQGAVKSVEILAYREAYGYEVRGAPWRAQFVGKTASSPLVLNQDISNISGATLSSKHVTDGIKRVLATYALALK